MEFDTIGLRVLCCSRTGSMPASQPTVHAYAVCLQDISLNTRSNNVGIRIFRFALFHSLCVQRTICLQHVGMVLCSVQMASLHLIYMTHGAVQVNRVLQGGPIKV